MNAYQLRLPWLNAGENKSLCVHSEYLFGFFPELLIDPININIYHLPIILSFHSFPSQILYHSAGCYVCQVKS